MCPSSACFFWVAAARGPGLFAVNFRLGGSAQNPTLSINPLSAIAPGILRRFVVDPLGGVPQGQLGQPPGQRRSSDGVARIRAMA